MGKGRVPCCDKNNVKRGPWSPQEDLTLITFIQKHGHQNWRSLPKLAGLKRCGKSCRLRWINYLRPDVKRGNFTKEEEDAIIHFHKTLGNKWSKIASHLPGRTDNEIKNIWNTHLKKRLSPFPSPSSSSSSISSTHDQTTETDHSKNCDVVHTEVHSAVNQSTDSSSHSCHLQGNCMNTEGEALHEFNELHKIQLLLDHDDFDDITSVFLDTNELLFPEQPLDSFPHHHHISTELHNTGEATREVTKPQSFDHLQLDIPCGFKETNGEFDLWEQLLESSSPIPSPNCQDYNNEWFNFIGDHTYFDDFTLDGEICL